MSPSRPTPGRPWAQLAGSAPAGLALLGALLLGACSTDRSSGGAAGTADARDPGAVVLAYQWVAPLRDEALSATQHTAVLRAAQTALRAQGMHEAAPGTAADLEIRLEYRVGPPREGRVTESEPVYEVTPGKLVDQSVPVSLNSGSTVYETRKVKEPDVVVYQGERPVVKTRTVYEKQLRLSARAPGAARELWSLELVADGPTRNLRPLLPALAGPARDYLGGPATGPTVIRLADDTGAIESVERTW